MTVRGSLTPINRHGINRARDISILRKASFEETGDMLFEAAAFSQQDKLNGVSERILFGAYPKLGTKVCEVMVNPNAVEDYVYKPAEYACSREK